MCFMHKTRCIRCLFCCIHTPTCLSGYFLLLRASGKKPNGFRGKVGKGGLQGSELGELAAGADDVVDED
jgi:hypothetical protein